ncbi:MAG: hypothetical protein GY716_25800 [bacterium]|nr:hypothetical protein [bacterium]
MIRTATRTILLLGLLAICVPAEAVELFGPAGVATRVGRSPDDLVAGDFDGDGISDLAVTQRGGVVCEDLETACTDDDDCDGRCLGLLRVLISDGSGGFSRQSELIAGAEPGAIAADDLDADGDLDLVVANRGDDTLVWFEADGRGGFAAAQSIAGSFSRPSDVELAHFNNDSLPDLVVCNADADSVEVLLGVGGGGFLPVMGPLSGVPAPSSVAVLDVDRNGLPDLVTSNPQQDALTVIPGLGGANFLAPRSVPLSDGAFPTLVIAADFLPEEGDELIAVQGGSDFDSIALLGAFDKSGLELLGQIEVGRTPRSAAATDLDGDGVTDIVVANRNGDSLTILRGDGLGGFVRRCTPIDGSDTCGETGTPAPTRMAIADVDVDGAADVVVINETAATVNTLLGDGLGGLIGPRDVAVGSGPESVATGDFDDDGLDDFVVANTSAGTLSVLLNDGLNGFVPGPDVTGFVAPTSVAAGDFDSNGTMDLAVADIEGGVADVRVLEGKGDGTFETLQNLDVVQEAEIVFAHDLDGDDVLDLVVVHAIDDFFLNPPNRVSLLRGQGDGAFVQIDDGTLFVRPGPGAVDVSDLNGDGHVDLVVTNRDADRVRIFMGLGDGAFEDLDIDIRLEGSPSSIVARDLDGDSRPDLVVALSDRSRTNVFRGRGDGTFEPVFAIDVAEDPRALAAGDVNNDGEIDLAVVSSGGDSATLLLGVGDGTLRRGPEIGVGQRPHAVAFVDFNGDTFRDLIAVNRRDGDVSILLNQLRRRADLDGSNRIDGFDIAALGRSAGLDDASPDYRGNLDVDLNGTIDCHDLAATAARFGEVDRELSSLRASLSGVRPGDSNSVTFQDDGAEGDRLRVRVMVDVPDDAASIVDFGVTFEPPEGESQVLEYVGYDHGDYLGGGIVQYLFVDPTVPGRIDVSGVRIPLRDLVREPQPLLDLVFRARRIGSVDLEFTGNTFAAPVVLATEPDGCEDGCPVEGVTFGAGVRVAIGDSGGDAPPAKIGFAPATLQFGAVSLSESSHRILRVSNFGFADLVVSTIEPDDPAFVAHFDGPVTIPAFGFVRLSVEFTPPAPGVFDAALSISYDPGQPPAVVPLSGTGAGF